MKEFSNKIIASKVPQVTIFFWIIKILCTTVGETFSDFISVTLGFGLTTTTIVMGIVLIVVFYLQFRSVKYNPVIYWLTVVLVSVVGTLITDNLTDVIGVPLQVSTVVFSIALAITFIAWYMSEKTLSIHSILTRHREAFYWLTVLVTFSLGTAVGDLMAEALGLGYLTTLIIVVAVILGTYAAFKLGLNEILAFWIVYILTRPLGASLGDLLSQPAEAGGLGLGTTITSFIFLVGILITVLYLKRSKIDTIEVRKEVNTGKKSNVVLQLIIVLCIFVGGGFLGYQHRINVLNNSSVAADLDYNDLSVYLTIEQEMLDMANNNDLASAKNKANDLESTWDANAAKLKAKNHSEWKEIDVTIDDVLKAVRTKQPTQADCQQNLKTSINTIEKYTNQNQ